jgi:flavin-binding protein dodecin
MSVARVTEIKSSSTKSFDDALKEGLSRATKTLKNVKSAWINQEVRWKTRQITMSPVEGHVLED